MVSQPFPTYSPFVEPIRNESMAVGTSVVQVDLARTIPNFRKDLLVRNVSPNSADIITIAMGNQQPSANAGIILRQYESFQMTSMLGDGRDIFQGQISAVCATANGILAIFER